ncbi:MAG: SDR family oxidoreductase [Proteobacteria bacterium]|nr:SDR family oxidoreductase [Pseudomonadota bacterium]
MNRLAGLSALVTGGTTGIGLETARHFLAEGARVAITGQNPERLEAARKTLGANVVAIRANAADAGAQKALAAEIAAKFGKLDILFANAGIAEFAPIEAVDEAHFDRQFATNVKGPYFLIKALLPHFAAEASVILNASVVAHRGMPNTAVYSATKSAVLGLARSLGAELAPRGIRINTISPGPIDTPIYSKLGLKPEEAAGMAESIRATVPMKRFGTTSEIADAAVFLASKESRYMLGAELVVGGGMATL